MMKPHASHLQLCFEYNHQYGEAHSDGDPIRQAEEERSQERHDPHTLDTRKKITSAPGKTMERLCMTAGGIVMHGQGLRNPICSSATGNRGQRAAAGCSSS